MLFLSDIILYCFPLRHAHYQTGSTPLALVWKDEHCSQYVIDTDGKGDIPSQQQVKVASPTYLCSFMFSCPPLKLFHQWISSNLLDIKLDMYCSVLTLSDGFPEMFKRFYFCNTNQLFYSL